jgi:hypothetical protein
MGEIAGEHQRSHSDEHKVVVEAISAEPQDAHRRDG